MSLHQASAVAENQASEEFVVICLCAEWCTTCREYRPGFHDLAAQFPHARFRWLDIEDQADDLGDLDIANFPTLYIKRQESVLFFGTMPPQLGHLQRMLEDFQERTPQQDRDYAQSSPERLNWQENPDIRHLGELYSNE